MLGILDVSCIRCTDVMVVTIGSVVKEIALLAWTDAKFACRAIVSRLTQTVASLAIACSEHSGAGQVAVGANAIWDVPRVAFQTTRGHGATTEFAVLAIRARIALTSGVLIMIEGEMLAEFGRMWMACALATHSLRTMVPTLPNFTSSTCPAYVT